MDASLDVDGPLYVRVAKGGDPIVSRADAGFTIGRAIQMRRGSDVTIISTGIMTTRALAAADLLLERGVAAGVVHMHTIKPLDAGVVEEAARSARLLVTLEEHTKIGGLGGAVAEQLADSGIGARLVRLGLSDAFSHTYGSQDAVLKEAGLAPDAIAAQIATRLAAV